MPPKLTILHGFNQSIVMHHGKGRQLDVLAQELSVLKERIG
jgi:hypothetical protein